MKRVEEVQSVRSVQPITVGSEDAGRNSQARKCRQHLEAKTNPTKIGGPQSYSAHNCILAAAQMGWERMSPPEPPARNTAALLSLFQPVTKQRTQSTLLVDS